MKVVLDTNVWISGLLLPQSIPGKIITTWQQGQFEVAISDLLIREIEKVLNYPKIRKRLPVTQEEIEEYVNFIRFFAELVSLREDIDTINHIEKLRDNKDAPILATLISSNSNYLITGDNDLLALDKYYPIISPSTFIAFLD